MLVRCGCCTLLLHVCDRKRLKIIKPGMIISCSYPCSSTTAPQPIRSSVMAWLCSGWMEAFASATPPVAQVSRSCRGNNCCWLREDERPEKEGPSWRVVFGNPRLARIVEVPHSPEIDVHRGRLARRNSHKCGWVTRTISGYQPIGVVTQSDLDVQRGRSTEVAVI